MATPNDLIHEAHHRLQAVIRLAESADDNKLEFLTGYDLYLLLEPVAERLDKALQEPPKRRKGDDLVTID